MTDGERGKHGGYYTTEYGSGFADGTTPWEENRGIGMSFGINRIEISMIIELVKNLYLCWSIL